MYIYDTTCNSLLNLTFMFTGMKCLISCNDFTCMLTNVMN